MKNKFVIALFISLSMAICFSACTRKNIQDIIGEQGCDTTLSNYAADIKPILDANCNTPGCHNASTQAGGYNLQDFASLQTAALGSRFLGSIRHESGFSTMPKGGGKLDDCQIKKIEIWVANGAQNN